MLLFLLKVCHYFTPAIYDSYDDFTYFHELSEGTRSINRV